MKKIMVLACLITALFTSCVRTAYKGADREVITHNVHNVFN